MSGLAWWLWAIVAVLLGLAELHIPGAYFIWLGLGASLTAVLEVAFGLSLQGQIVAFVVASALSCALGYFVYRRFAPTSEPLNQRNMQLVGARGTVCEAIENGQGKVRIGDSVWLAEGPTLAAGAAIVVKSVRGARVVVEAASS
jgi:inner membrane protein